MSGRDTKDTQDTQEHNLTKSGYKYVIEESTGLRIRNSLAGHRLKNDDESYEEYRARQRIIKKYQRDKRRSNIVWPSVNKDDLYMASRGKPMPDAGQRNLGTFRKKDFPDDSDNNEK